MPKFKNCDYAPAHCHTDKSRFDGLARPDKSVMRARELGFPAMGCTDHGTVAAWIKFVAECTRKKDKKGNEIPFPTCKPMLGCEWYLARNHKYKDTLNQPDGRTGNRHFITFAKNWKGFQNLCRLSEMSWCEGFYHSPRIDIEQLAAHAEGLIASSACLSSVINASLLNDKYDQAKKAASIFKDIFKEDFFLEVMYHGIDAEGAIIPDVLKLGAQLDIPVIATNDVHYITKDMAKSHEALMCMSTSKCILDPKHLSFPYDEFYLKDANEMGMIFGHRPELLYNTVALAERIDDREIATNMGGMRLPAYKVPPPFKTPEEYLEHLAWEGMERLGWRNSPEHCACLKKELGDVRVAHENNGYDFATYFLVVWDYIAAARKKNILTGCGRGCLTADVPLMTSRGFLPIGEVQEGERVLTASGEQKLVLIKHQYEVDNERMVRIRSCHGDFGGLTLTHDHKVSIERQKETPEYTRATHGLKEKVRRFCRPAGKREWVPASSVNIGDWMFVPWSASPKVFEIPCLDLSKYADGRRIVEECDAVIERWMIGRTDVVRSSRRINRVLKADERFAWIIGKFVSDGWFRVGPTRRNSVYFCANTSELSQLDFIKDYFREQGITDFKETKHPSKDVVELSVKSLALHSLFVDLFSDYRQKSSTKHLPVWFRRLTPTMRAALSQGLFAGDGHCGPCERKATYTTTSPRLAFEVKELLHSIKCPAGVHRESGGVRNNYSVMSLKHPAACCGKYGYEEIHNFVSISNDTLKNTFIADDGFYTRVRSKEEFSFSGKVYDLTVDTESNFVSSNGLVHNSGYASILLRTLGITYGPDPLKYNLLWERFLGFDDKQFYLASDFGLEEEVDIAAIADAVEEEDDEDDLFDERGVEDDAGGVDRY